MVNFIINFITRLFKKEKIKTFHYLNITTEYLDANYLPFNNRYFDIVLTCEDKYEHFLKTKFESYMNRNSFLSKCDCIKHEKIKFHLHSSFLKNLNHNDFKGSICSSCGRIVNIAKW